MPNIFIGVSPTVCHSLCEAAAMITEPISMFLRSALYKRTVLAALKKIQRLKARSAKFAAFINSAGVSSNQAFLYDFLVTATQQRHAATAAGAWRMPAWQRQRSQSHGAGRLCPKAGNSHFATILVIKLKADLNPKDLSIILVSYLLND
jgi:hypothetical protein